MKTLAILGLGLMGGSLGLAAKRGNVAARVQAYARREESRREAHDLGAVDESFDTPDAAVADADLVVVCIPILGIPELIGSCTGALRSGAVITDVGSTKFEIAEALIPLLASADAEFIGSHPLAGSEQTGLGAAHVDLYQDAAVVVTPTQDSSPDALALVQSFWQSLGARTETMPPQTHDALIARTSHLPHLVAAALVHTVLGKSSESARLCASGFRDTTRVAAGSETMWHDIIKTNPEAVSQALGDMIASLQDMRERIDRGEFDRLRSFLESCRQIRQDL